MNSLKKGRGGSINRNILTVALGYLGAVIGAGFVSGQEIMQFFVIYRQQGFWGVILAGALFCAMGGILLCLCSLCRASNYQQLLKAVFGPTWSKVMDFSLSIFLFFGICTMFSASGAVFYEHLYLSKNLGVLLAYVGVLFLLAGGIRGLVVSYNLLVPVKILLLLIIAGYAAFYMEGNGTASLRAYIPVSHINYWLLAAILYVAYNFALAMVVLAEYLPLVGKKDGVNGAALGGLMLGGIAAVYYLALHKFMPTTLHYEVPMLFIAGNISSVAKGTYVIVLWVGILTTAIANAYGFVQRFSQLTGLSYRVSLGLILTAALPLSFQSFSLLVATVYPLFGMVGTIILAGILAKTLGLMARAIAALPATWWARISKGG